MPINQATGSYKPHDPSDTASAYIEADEKENMRLYGRPTRPQASQSTEKLMTYEELKAMFKKAGWTVEETV